MNPFPFPPNAGPELYCGKRIDLPLDTSSDETLELWAAQPEWDDRSLEEFAAEGGRPVFPPNRVVRQGFSLPGLVRSFVKALTWYRGFLRAFAGRPRHGYLPELSPETPELDRYGRTIPPKPTYRPPAPPPKFETGYLRSSVPPLPRGGTAQSSTIVGGLR